MGNKLYPKEYDLMSIEGLYLILHQGGVPGYMLTDQEKENSTFYLGSGEDSEGTRLYFHQALNYINFEVKINE